MQIKLKCIIVTLCVLIVSLTLKAQDPVIDSLKNALKNAKHDTTKIKIYSHLSEICEVEDILQYAEPCIKLCEKGAASSTSQRSFYLMHLANAFNNVGFLTRQQGEVNKALDYYTRSLKIQEEIKDKPGIASSLNNIGIVYKEQGDISKTVDYLHRSLKILEEIKDKKGMATTLNNIGAIYNNQGDIPKALDYYHKSLKIQEELKDDIGIAKSYNNLGFIYNNLGDIARALDYYKRCLILMEKVKDKKGLAFALNNIGGIYKNLSESPDSAAHRNQLLNIGLTYYQRGLKLREEIKDVSGIAYSLINIGGIYNNQGDIQKALEYYQRSLKIHEEIKDKHGITTSLNNMAAVMLQLDQLGVALQQASKSLKLSKELGYPSNIKNAATTLKKIYKKQNNFKLALEMYELEMLMQDSITNAETKKASIKKQFQYQYEKKAAADSVKNAEEQKVKNAQLTAQQAQLKQEKTQRFALYGGLALVVVFLGFIYNRFRITNRQKHIIEQQKELVDEAFKKLEEKNKEVMDSIYYARRIQNSLLTSEKYIAKQLNRLIKR